MEGSLAENVRNAKLLLLQLVGTMFNISFFLRMLFFLIRQEYFQKVLILFNKQGLEQSSRKLYKSEYNQLVFNLNLHILDYSGN